MYIKQQIAIRCFIEMGVYDTNRHVTSTFTYMHQANYMNMWWKRMRIVVSDDDVLVYSGYSSKKHSCALLKDGFRQWAICPLHTRRSVSFSALMFSLNLITSTTAVTGSYMCENNWRDQSVSTRTLIVSFRSMLMQSKCNYSD